MGPSIDLYCDYGWDDNAITRWQKFYSKEEHKKLNLKIDEKNLIFLYNIFLESLKNPKCEVSFGYDHDSILYHTLNHSEIELVNIDHHHDILYSEYCDDDDIDDMNLILSYDTEYRRVSENKRINEGNWVCKLSSENLIKSYTWIGNKNSFSELRKCEVVYFKSIVPKFKMVKREEFKIENYNFDKVFVCLSPQFVPQQYWHYFKILLMLYEKTTGKKYNLEEQVNKKFETEIRHQLVTNEILY
jgi:hypothetical protein